MNSRISISPKGRLLWEPNPAAASDSLPASLGEESARLIQAAFRESSAEGLLLLAGQSLPESLPPELTFWRDGSRRLIQAICHLDSDRLATFVRESTHQEIAKDLVPDKLSLAASIAEAPPMRGLEYLTVSVLAGLWQELADLISRRAAECAGGVAELLRSISPCYELLGRVTFHLAENRHDTSRPFAFLATFANKLSAKSKVQHLPLAEALRQYAAQRDQKKLAELLAPVRLAAERSPQVKAWIDSRALFQPQSLSIAQAHQFLRDVPLMEQSGLVVRVPNWWQARKPPRPTVQVRLGDQPPSAIGADGLLDFSIHLVLDGEVLTDAERKQLLSAANGLTLLRGKWVEVDRDKLQQALDQWQQLRSEHASGIDFLKGMRLLAGAAIDSESSAAGAAAEWIGVSAGKWLEEMLARLRDPRGVVGCSPGQGLNATLRPYQADGVRWLWFLANLRLGACLADDMGLGKTIQIIDLLLRLREPTSGKPASPRQPSLLVVPASLLGNWRDELRRFAPQLKVAFAHRSESDDDFLDRLANNPQRELADHDLLITTYTHVRKAEWIAKVDWRLVVLDEAQAIKNPSSAQTRSVKQLRSQCRIALTGTPVENQLGDLWSLFDFCSPGLLGSAKRFKAFIKRLSSGDEAHAYGALRRLVQPYILRRLKTDPGIVPDLPEKTEMRVDCGLSKQQAALYQQAVDALAKSLEKVHDEGKSDGIQRRGIVLSTMMRLKQICNHPAQYLGQAEFSPERSGKFARLADICEPIAERQEKALVFTQFQSICEPLAEFLRGVFGRAGLVLHGGVPVGKRKELVRRFQEEEDVAFMVISVKAGGTGLNLTAASHVIHFDRWWNPAVENQATDRAFRIGQKRNVLVHKFVCRGTLEERIDQMIREKRQLAEKILGPTREGETLLTEMTDQELLRFVALDISRAGGED